MDTFLEYVSQGAQIGVGVLSLWVSWRLWHLKWYAVPALIVGATLIATGSTGLANVGALETVVRYRRPLFVIERLSVGTVFLYIVVRNETLTGPRKGRPAGRQSPAQTSPPG